MVYVNVIQPEAGIQGVRNRLFADLELDSGSGPE
jgi:hypothetical protein